MRAVDPCFGLCYSAGHGTHAPPGFVAVVRAARFFSDPNLSQGGLGRRVVRIRRLCRGGVTTRGQGASFGESLDRDVKFGATQAGPHRADLRLRTTSEAAADALSRGQAKALAMALRLAQAQHTASVAGRRSLFLVDDLGAELDRAHSGRFFSVLQRMGCQVLATATSDPGDALDYQGTRGVFHVEHGRCVRTQ